MKLGLLSLLLLAGIAFPAIPVRSESTPSVDPKRIINESNEFLKDREPEMSVEEYTLYEKVLTMLSTNPEFAVKLLEAMGNDKEPPSPAFEFILGNAYYAAGQTTKSEEKYRSSVKRYPSFLRAWVNLGVLYFATERYKDAIPCFSKAITLGDRDSSTFGMLGYSLEKQGNIVSSEMAYMQALSGDPGSADWKEGLLRICVEGKQFSRAESLVKTIIKDRPSEYQFWLIYANILLSEDRKLDATVLLEAAAGMGVANAEELSLLGDLYADQDLVPEAASAYRKVLASSAELGETKLLHFARILTEDGKLQAAQDILDTLQPKVSSDGQVEFLQDRADLLVAQKHWPEARGELENLLKLQPLNGKALLSLGRNYLMEEDVPRATLAFEQASNIPATAYVASLELSNIELKNRHYAKCAEYLEKALSIQKTDAVEDFLARVKTMVDKDDHTQQ
jgi:tetratricopeptide (TPR) repeat protein